MGKRSTIKWKPGAVFGIPLPTGRHSLGQALGLMGKFANVVNCALFDIQFDPGAAPQLEMKHLIAIVSTTRDLLDSGDWVVVGNEPPCISKSQWPNEQFARKGYEGAETHGSGIINNFVAAYHGLYPWNHYRDPAYFDKLLVSPAKRPSDSQLQFKPPTT